MAINYHNNKIIGIRRASGDTCRWAGYTQIFYNRETGNVWAVDHCDRNSWTLYHDPAIILVANTSRHLTMQDIADRVAEKLAEDSYMREAVELAGYGRADM